MKTLIYLNNFILFIILIVGTFGILIISHEAYHYFTVDGNAKGICFGNCNLQGSYINTSYNGTNYASGAITWEFSEEQNKKLNLDNQEKGAWTFSIIFTIIILSGLLVTEYYK